MFMSAGAAGRATTVVDEHVVHPVLSLPLTIFCREVMAKASKGGARGSDVGEKEGRALVVERGSGEEEVRRAENRVGVED